MFKDFINQAGELQEARMREWAEQTRVDAMRREARTIRRLRRAVGHKLIALGQRLADKPPPAQKSMDTAA